MKTMLLAVLLASNLELAQAQKGSPADLYFAKQNPKLNKHEKAALAIAQKWQKAEANGVKPTAGAGGLVRFVYGQQQVTVVCAVLQACDVELQPGEVVNNLNVGDTRFTIEPAYSGSATNLVQHLILKPQDVGLDTSLAVTTNRRTYHIRLRSHRTEYMPWVAFSYPDEALAKWDSGRVHPASQSDERALAPFKGHMADLSFAYAIDGKAPWKPLRVYDDGTRTVIQMPNSMKSTEAPILLVVRQEGKLFRAEETEEVNYRVHEDRYIIDRLFHKAFLIAGVGTLQDRVTITREK